MMYPVSMYVYFVILTTPLLDTAAGVRLYLNELMEQVCPGISAQSWEVKRTAANALSTIAEKIGKHSMKFVLVYYS